LAKAHRQLSYEKVVDCIEKSVASLKGKHVDVDLLAKVKAEALKAISNRGFNPNMRLPPKEVELFYRGETIKMAVTSALDHYNCAAESFIRGLAVDTGKLQALWAESDLLGNRAAQTGSVSEDCVLLSLGSRQLLADQLDKEDASAANIKRTLKAKHTFLMSTDKHWRIEFSFWDSLVGQGAETKMHARVLDCLPSAAKPLTVDTSLGLFQVISNSALFAFVGPSLQTVVKTVHGYVSAIASGKPPSIEKLDSTVFATSVLAALSLFCTWQGSASSSGPAAKSSGALAAKAHLTALLADVAAKKQLKYGDLVLVLPFEFLLDAAETKVLLKLKADTLSKSGMASSSGASSSASSSKKCEGKAATKDTRAMVRALFKKK
jgi:hypothetical protein